ncbi:uncharacterized protein [Littorina saxatilis]|uniref:Uncharacterized protein n=1 Tax=Littorina saxatilis TaxID=31220 RepID=A0AAN9C2B2_9CAEN
MAEASGQTHHSPWSEDIRKQTRKFYKELLPFMLHGLDDSGITQARLQSVRARLMGEREEPREQNPMGDVRDANLIATTSLLLEDYETAKAETESALEKDHDNLIANANLAVLLWKQGNKAKAEKQLSVWRSIQDEELEIRGKAELAYCFGRLGPEFTAKAVRIYEEVVGQKPNEYDWKFGLAMQLSRQTRANTRMCHGVTSNDVLQKAQAAVKLLQDIKIDDAASHTLRGHAAAELGFLLCTEDRRLAKHLKNNNKYLKAQQCFEEAYEWAPDDVCVLNNYGRFLKYTGKLEEAKKLLLKSVKQRPTGTAHDILGLVYQRLAEVRKRKEMIGPQKQTRHNKGKNKNKKQNIHEQKDLTASNGTKPQVSLASEHGSVSPTLLLKDCSLENKNEVQTKTSRTRQSRNRKSRLVDQEKPKHLIQNETEAPKHDESQIGNPRKKQKPGQAIARGRESENGAGRSDLKLEADDEDIKQAILHFEEAVKLSNDENTTSLYHLQNLLKLIGDMEGALIYCERIVGQDKSVFSPRNNISALEKAGLIELQISREKEDETERRQHQQRGKELLYQALEIQHTLLEQDRTLRSMFIKKHESFRTLLDMNEQDTCISELERLKVKGASMVQDVRSRSDARVSGQD